MSSFVLRGRSPFDAADSWLVGTPQKCSDLVTCRFFYRPADVPKFHENYSDFQPNELVLVDRSLCMTAAQARAAYPSCVELEDCAVVPFHQYARVRAASAAARASAIPLDDIFSPLRVSLGSHLVDALKNGSLHIFFWRKTFYHSVISSASAVTRGNPMKRWPPLRYLEDKRLDVCSDLPRKRECRDVACQTWQPTTSAKRLCCRHAFGVAQMMMTATATDASSQTAPLILPVILRPPLLKPIALNPPAAAFAQLQDWRNYEPIETAQAPATSLPPAYQEAIGQTPE